MNQHQKEQIDFMLDLEGTSRQFKVSFVSKLDNGQTLVGVNASNGNNYHAYFDPSDNSLVSFLHLKPIEKLGSCL